jgi:hypothetical protein
MVKRTWLGLVIIIFLLSACSATTSSNSAPDEPQVYATAANTELYAGTSKGDYESYDTSSSPVGDSSSTIVRMVITNASLSIIVVDPAATMNFIATLAGQMQGYVVSSDLYKTMGEDGYEYPYATITVRVPAGKLSDAIAQIKGEVEDPATDILTENISGQDITKEYTDLQSQLTNLQEAEAQLQKIMDSATTVEDVLNVYYQLTSVRSQIEVLQGQIKYYDEAVALSSLTVSISAKASIQPVTIGGWEPVGVARDAVQALISGLKILVNVIIWSGIFCLPFIIIIGIPVYFILKGIRRWKNKQKAKEIPPVPNA